MPVDPEEGLVTDLMFGLMIAFGADIILIVGALWLIGTTSTLTFLTTTGLIVGAFAAWIGWRWRAIRRIESAADPERAPLDELKHQYAAGEIDEATFERKLDALVDSEERAVRADGETTELAAGRSE
ncbi:SHOCT domain-containing protein [Halohasta salina]|uniref:SHOCT domain-containing protein n=1 Tax=Halohasta salina TaxID=2961621 RepID=UPI0020A2A57D|nr:SHOCT domain-containing protein [Halohasta salina]